MDTTQGFADLPIAVIGMACRLPGARNLEQFWKLLLEGRCEVAEVPADRFDQELYYDPRQGIPAKSYTKIGALLDDRRFDRENCPLPEELVRSADPTHLLMCEVAAAACRQAGLDPFNLSAEVRNAGVYVGHAQGSTLAGDYIYHTCVEEAAGLLGDLKELEGLPPAERSAVANELVERVRKGLPQRTPDSPDVSTNMVAGLVSKAFGLTGPYLALNAACASSPQALLLAVRALQLGRIEMAIVGGASDCKSDTLTLFSAAQSMSASGTRPFDAEADGLVCGEGYVALVLKTLPRALADGDPIQAVIRSLGISSDGHGKSLWAPRKEGQIEAMKRAYRGDLDPASVQYIEAHATSTSLGDATELTALGEVLGERAAPGPKIALGSVKANIGHTLECAGLASVCKTILCLQKQTIPGAINIRHLNKKIDWQSVPYYVPMSPTPWPAPPSGQPRRAAVNSFGIGGLNMHMVLEEFSPASHARDQWSRSSGRARNADGDAIAVIGMGCILPGAQGADQFWDLLASGRDAKCQAPPDRWPDTEAARRLPTKLGGFITDFAYDWRRHKVPPKQVAQADPMQFMLLEAADQALRHAGYTVHSATAGRTLDKKRAGVLVGTEFGGDFGTQLTLGLRLPHMQKLLGESLAKRGMRHDEIERAKEAFAKALLARWPALIDETGSFSTSTLASRITKTLDLMGGAAAIDSGDTSAMSALAGSIDLLLAGDCDVMFCAAGQRRMAPATYEALAMAGVLAAGDNPAAPLDARARGFVPGEGVGVVMLKRLADARRDGDTIQAIIRGVGAGRADTAGDAIALAMQRSLDMAGIDSSDLAVLEIDGHGLPKEDREIAGVARDLFRQDRPQPLLVGTAVGQLGHTGGASGMVSLLKASVEIEKGTAPAIVGLQNPLPETEGQRLVVPCEPMPIRHATVDGRRLAGVVSHGKGLAFHVILERAQRVPVSQPAAIQQPERCSQPAKPFPPTVTVSPMSLRTEDKIEIVARPAPHASDQRRPRVAFLFPGQGSQHAGMLRGLVAASPAARAAMEEIDGAMRRAGEPTFAELAWNDGGKLGSDIWRTQIAMLLADLIVDAALRERGIVPDVVAGHSFGEIAALTAAGAWDLSAAIQIVKARAAGVAAGGSRGALMATSAPRERIEELAAALQQPIYVANHNAPSQTVVGGSREALEALSALLKQHSISGQMLSVPAAFHTPLMLGASGPLEAALHAATVRPPRVPLISSVTCRYEADPVAIRENLARQLTRPVEWVALIRRLASEGPVVLIEVGPQQVLTKLCRKILQDRPSVWMIAADDPTGDAAEQLDRVRDVLISAGAIDDAKLAAKAMPAPRPSQQRGKVVHFDATEARRGKMRDAALRPEPASVPQRAAPQPAAAMHTAPAAAENRIAAALAGPEPTKDNGHAVHATPAHAKSNGAPPAVDPAQLESFLVNFVVEQTGYPPDVVDLDADLEADLGIDSIKKAQMFGELQEYFPDVVQPREDLTLDDFPTLRHVLDFLRGEMPQPAEPPVTPAVAAVETKAAASATSLPAPVALREEAAPAKHAATDPAQLESFLVNFVVEQTGYPPDVVDLDADLEADLGIDSIKKAQMFGELQEYFPDVVQPRDDLTLDDFPTLRHVLNFLRCEQGATQPAAAKASSHQSNGDVSHAAELLEADSPLTLCLSGSPYEMGLEHGRQLQAAIRRILRYYADLAGDGLDELPLAELREDPSRLFTADELEEMRGIAEGAGVPVGNIVAHNLALLADLGVGTTQLIVPGNGSAQTLHALEEPLPLAAGLRQELSPVVQVRDIADGVPHALCSFAGLVFGVSGINAYGLAVSSASLSAAKIARGRGRLPALLVGEVLAKAADVEAAVEIARQFQSLTPWNACISDSTTGRACYLERDGAKFQVHTTAEAAVATCDRGHSSNGRLRPLAELVDSEQKLSSAASVRQALSICRGGQKTGNGAVAVAAEHDATALHIIMQPAARQLWLGGVGPANGSLLGVRIEELNGGLPPGSPAGAESLKKKAMSPRPRS